MSFGDADPNRQIVVVLGHRTRPTPTRTVTVNGVSATELLYSESNVSNQIFGRSVWIASVPTGTSGDVVVNLSAGAWVSGSWAAVSLYRLVGFESTAYDTATSTSAATTIDIEAGGVVIAGFSGNSNITNLSYTGLTSDEEEDIGVTTDSFASASHESVSGETGRSVFIDNGSDNAEGASYVSISPQ